jgi:hypothetical protein
MNPEWKEAFTKIQKQTKLNDAIKSMNSMKINNIMIRKDSDENIMTKKK